MELRLSVQCLLAREQFLIHHLIMGRGSCLAFLFCCLTSAFACSGGSTTQNGGAGGASAGMGGTSAGRGGSGTGGASAGTGGSASGAGGASAGTGGTHEGGSGASSGTGGNTGGTGGTGGGSEAGAAGLAGAGGGGVIHVVSDFTRDLEGWQCGFSDYPQGQDTFYELRCQQATLPPEMGAGGAVLMGGNNHSDDLFMYLARQITGLAPSTKYQLDVKVEIGTNAPADCGGIGGAPGPSVYFKIGASPLKPMSALDSQGFLRLNLDKGNQSVGGADLKLVGDLSNTLHCPDASYQAKTLSLASFSVQSSADGSVWVVVGTDSGFEGITVLYYDRITITLSPSN